MISNLYDTWNKFKYRFRYNYGKDLRLKVPVDIALELSSYCNMSCSYCYHSKDNEKNLPFKKGFMPSEMAYKIIKEGAELGVHSLKFNYRGEGTMNPYFKSIAYMARAFANGSTYIDRVINSNFKFMPDREDIFDGLSCMTKVKVSYDSFNKSVFEKQRAGGDHDKTTKNIDIFYNHPKRKNTELVIQAVRTQFNKNEDIEAEVKRRWSGATVSIRNVVDGRKQDAIDKMLIKARDFSNRQSCIQAHVRLIVHHDGIVVPCCPSIDSSLKIGDVSKMSLHEIFNSDKAKALRKSLKDKTAFSKYKSCQNCPSHESFKGYKPQWNS